MVLGSYLREKNVGWPIDRSASGDSIRAEIKKENNEIMKKNNDLRRRNWENGEKKRDVAL